MRYTYNVPPSRAVPGVHRGLSIYFRAFAASAFSLLALFRRHIEYRRISRLPRRIQAKASIRSRQQSATTGLRANASSRAREREEGQLQPAHVPQ